MEKEPIEFGAPKDKVAVLKGDVLDTKMFELHKLQGQAKRRSWLEDALLIAQFHALAQEVYGQPEASDAYKSGWSQTDTARALGASLSTIITSIRLAKCYSVMPELAACRMRNLAVDMMNKKFYWVGDGIMLERKSNNERPSRS